MRCLAVACVLLLALGAVTAQDTEALYAALKKAKAGAFSEMLENSALIYTLQSLETPTILAPTDVAVTRYLTDNAIDATAIPEQDLITLTNYHSINEAINFNNDSTVVPGTFSALRKYESLASTGFNCYAAPGPVLAMWTKDGQVLFEGGADGAVANFQKTAKRMGGASEGPVDGLSYYVIDNVMNPCCVKLPSVFDIPVVGDYLASTDPDVDILYTMLWRKVSANKDLARNATIYFPEAKAVEAALKGLNLSRLNDTTRFQYLDTLVNSHITINLDVGAPTGWARVLAAGGKLSAPTMLFNKTKTACPTQNVTLSMPSTTIKSYKDLRVSQVESAGGVTAKVLSTIKGCNNTIIYIVDKVLLPCNLTGEATSPSKSTSAAWTAGPLLSLVILALSAVMML